MEGIIEYLESIKFVHLFMSPTIIWQSLPLLWKGFQAAAALLIIGYLLSLPAGLTAAFMKMSKNPIVRIPATFYIDFIRGTPLLVQILVIYFGFPLLMPGWREFATGPIGQLSVAGIDMSQFVRAVAALVINSGAYLAEIFRAGIQSISKGQLEAARSLGMTTMQAMAYVIIPQTVRRILPTMMSEFILLFKDTALFFAVGIFELTLQARTIQARTFNMSPYIGAAGFYLMLTLPLGRLVAYLEAKLAVSETGREPENRQERKRRKAARAKEASA
ncbi:MAG: amino acid ABC transporter permease [Coriobacteriia bacterium]|nr:amino acid ABC transporter permease [Coriobacteriia bacterium]